LNGHRGILKEFIELHNLLPFSFRRMLNAAFGDESRASVDTNPSDFTTAQIPFRTARFVQNCRLKLPDGHGRPQTALTMFPRGSGSPVIALVDPLAVTYGDDRHYRQSCSDWRC